MIVQLSSHICPSDIKEELFKLFKTVDICPLANKCLEIVISPCSIGRSLSASGRMTDGPLYDQRLVKNILSSGRQ